MPSLIVTSATQEYNNFTQGKMLYSLDMLLGANTTTSTPTIIYGDSSTYRFAVRMPSIGLLHMVRVMFESQTGGDANGSIDFSLWRSPWDAPDRHVFWDRLYEQKGIRRASIWEHNLSASPLVFANRTAYIGTDPSGETVTYPRNFMWMEAKPTDATSVAPIIRVNLIFEV